MLPPWVALSHPDPLKYSISRTYAARGNLFMTRRTLVFLAFIALLVLGAAYVDAPNNGGLHLGDFNNDLKPRLGLDLQGGVQVLLQATCTLPNHTCQAGELSHLDDARNNIEQRVNGGLGVSEPVIRTEGNNLISVELPGLKNEQDAVKLLGQTGKMEIIDTGSVQLQVNQPVPQGSNYPVVFTGADLDSGNINATVDQQTGQPVILFQFKGAKQSAFSDYTRTHVGQYLTITLDGVVIESAVIQSQITGQGQISGGSMTLDSAQRTAALLRYGSLPVPLTIVSEREIAATLGQQSIRDSAIAGVIGISIVILFMLIYYRLPGLLADIALLLYAGFTFAVFKLLSVVLTLAGIAGFVLSIGMAVDANVLIFERVKEELRSGRTLAQAVDVGFKRAWPSIRDSNASTLITCAILYWFGSNFGASIIVGFATTLFLGVVISLFTAITVTRTFLNLLVPTGVATHTALFGLPRGTITVPGRRRAALPERPASRARVVEVEEEEAEEEETKAKPTKALSLRERLAQRASGKAKQPEETAEDEEEEGAGDAEASDETEEAEGAEEEAQGVEEKAGEMSSNGATGNKQETARAGRAGSKRGVEE
jgi:preprotein translocase subunit SecD